MKTCSKCKETKEFSEFYRDRGNLDGRVGTCKVCRSKDRHENYELNQEWQTKQSNAWKSANPERKRSTLLKKRYGITLDQYNQMFIKQNGCCATCDIHQNDLSKKLFVDHDHTTGEVRGLLCSNCNVILGLAYDDTTVLENLKTYLNRSKIKIVETK